MRIDGFGFNIYKEKIGVRFFTDDLETKIACQILENYNDYLIIYIPDFSEEVTQNTKLFVFNNGQNSTCEGNC